MSKTFINQLILRGNALLESHYLALTAVFLLALVYRLHFFSGFDQFDEILYANSAQALTRGEFNINIYRGGAGRIGHYGPLALLYLVFGPSMSATMAWPLISSLITITIIYQIANLLSGRAAAILAATFSALLPIAIFMATHNYPDGPMAMFSTAVVVFWLVGRNTRGSRSFFAYLVSLIFFVWGFWTKEFIIFTGAFLLLFSLVEQIYPLLSKFSSEKARNWIVLGALVTALLLVYLYGTLQPVSLLMTLAVTSLDTFSMLATEPLFYIFFPMLVIALVLAAQKNHGAITFTASWLVFTFLAMEWAPITFDPTIYTPSPFIPSSARGMLILMPPVAILFGQVFSGKFHVSFLNKCLTIVSIFLIGFILLARHSVMKTEAVLAISVVALVLFVLSCFHLPSLIARNSKITRVAFLVLIFLFGLAIINPLQKAVDFRYHLRAYYRNLQSVSNFLAMHPDSLAYFSKDEDLRVLTNLNFVSDYVLAPDPFDELSGRMRVYSESSEVDENAFIVITDPQTIDTVSPSWKEVAHFTQPATYVYANPFEVYIFQSNDLQMAAQDLAEAEAASLTSPASTDAYENLFSAAVNASSPEIAFKAYMRLLELDAATSESREVLIRLIENNLSIVGKKPNLFLNPVFANGLQNWETEEAENSGVKPLINGSEVSLGVANDTENIPLSQHIILQPNTAYVFEVEIKGTGEFEPLYIWHRDFEVTYEASIQSLDQFSRLQMVFVTPDWDRPQIVLAAPVSILGAANITFRNPSIMELELGRQ